MLVVLKMFIGKRAAIWQCTDDGCRLRASLDSAIRFDLSGVVRTRRSRRGQATFVGLRTLRSWFPYE